MFCFVLFFLMQIFVLCYVNELCIYPEVFKLVCLRLRTDLTNMYVSLVHCSPNLC